MPKEAREVERDELWEWLGLIAAVLVWWPALFDWFPLWYRILVYLFCGAVIVVVGVRRVGRVREGLKYSQEIMDVQRAQEPLEPLEGKKGRKT